MRFKYNKNNNKIKSNNLKLYNPIIKMKFFKKISNQIQIKINNNFLCSYRKI